MKLKQLLVLTLLAFGATSLWAYDFSAVAPNGQTLYYNIVSGHAEVVRPGYGSTYNNYVTGDLVIPASVTYSGTTYPVTSIGGGAFENCTGLTSVIIPNSVTLIGYDAFEGCTGLTSITIGSSVTSIGNNAFYGCSGYTSTVYTGTIAQWCGISFGNYSANPLSNSQSLTIGGSEITSLVIPNGVTEIKQYAFCGCSSLTSVTIPSNVSSIGSCAFGYCGGLTSVTFNAESCITSSSIDSSVFYGCSNITNFTFGSNVEIIPNYLCYGLSGLTSVTIPNSVVSIGEGAFYYCWKLTSVIIPSSVTSIGVDAFFYVKHIDYYGSATGSPWGAISMNGVTEGDYVYSDATKHVLLAYIGAGGSAVIPSTVETIGTKAFYGCTGLTSVTIPNSVTSIGDYAFRGCTGLTSIIIPSSVTSIGYGAFAGCTGLTSVTIPNSVIWIGDASFYNCSGLTSVTIGGSVTSIGSSAFRECTGLTSVTIGSGVTSIGSYAFYNCYSLTSVSIGSGVTSIGEKAFSSCSSIHDFISKAVYPPTAQSNTFDNVPADCTLTVPCGSVPHYEAAEPWNTRFPQKEEDCNTEGITDVEGAGILVQVENGRITVEGTDEEYVVYDMMGRMVRNESLPDGVYLVKIGSLPARRVVVIR